MNYEEAKRTWLDSVAQRDVPQAQTDSGLPLNLCYGPDDLDSFDYAKDLGFPGQPPYTRGVYDTMYRTNLWTFRQYAGFGTAEESNARYQYLLSQGQTALSVAFDLPTQLGYDCDSEVAKGEVGRVGVAVSTIEDMEDLFKNLPLDRLSVNFTINATAPLILALYLAVARRHGVPWDELSGTLQNDILKEYLARKTYIFPPEPSLRLVGDVVEFCATNVPRFNPISVTGYHAREAGCDAVQELAFAMSSADTYVNLVLKRGLDIDDFAPRLSFHFSTTLDFFEEIAKLRAARRMWARLVAGRYRSKNPRSAALRFFSGCSGTSLTAVEPLNNIIRSTIQCLAAVLGGAQSIHVMAYDEALEIPAEEAVLLSLRTQQIIAHETGVPSVIDPLGGSYLVENLTGRLEREAYVLMDKIDDLGGMVSAIGSGALQGWIAETAYNTQRAIHSGDKHVVGLNMLVRNDAGTSTERPRLFEADRALQERQTSRLAAVRAARDSEAVARALEALKVAAAGEANLMPLLIDAVEAKASVGEISDALREVFGEYKEPVVV
jgi:methylmalonyl-CoA mutase N-terminal domain/subunit